MRLNNIVRILGVFSHWLLLERVWGYFCTGDVRRGFWEWIFRIFVQDSGGDGVIMSAVGNNGN